jgi:outer membrane protein OmpA-like peptidoglycan-associated protein
MMGLGKDKPLGKSKTREAATQNRRVEAKVFGADQITAPLSGELS